MGTSRLSPRRNPSATASAPGPYTLTRAIGRLYLDDSGGAFSVQLPDPAQNVGQEWELVRTGGTQNAVTLVRFAAEQIQGAAQNRILRAPFGTWILSCDGVNWRLAGQNRLDLIYTSSDVLTIEAGWAGAETYMRPGAGGGGGGGGGANADAGTTGGGGGKGGGGGCVAVGVRRNLLLPVAGTVLTITVGTGGAGGAGGAAETNGGNGGTGTPSEILDGATVLARAAHQLSLSVFGGGGGGTGGNGATTATGASGGGQAGTAADSFPNGWGTVAIAGGNGGNGTNGGAGANGTTTQVPVLSGAPYRGTDYGAGNPAGTGGAAGGGQGGGGGGGAGGASTYADEFTPAGAACGANAGRGGFRATTEGNGGAGNAAGVGAAGEAGAAGNAGTNGRGGGGGMGGGGGGSGSGGGGAGGTGGTGGAGSDGVVVITVWE